MTWFKRDLPPAPNDQPPTNADRSYRLETKKYRIEKLTLILLFLYTLINYCLYQSTKETFHAAERGWVGITDITVEHAFLRDTKPKTIEVVGSVNVRNFGPRPIFHSITRASLSADTDVEKVCDASDKLCDEAWIFATAKAPKYVGLSFKTPIGVVIFPEKDYAAQIDYAAELPISRPFPIVLTG